MLTGAGTDTIENAGTLELAAANAQIVTFAGSGGFLIANGTITGGAATGISATSTSGGAMMITDSGNVTSASADAIDATDSGGTGNIFVTVNGTVTGAINGLSAIQNGSGDIIIGGSGAITGQSGYGILAQQTATGLGGVLIDGTGNVVGTGSSFDGIFAEILNAADGANITIDQTGSVTGGQSGIEADTNGTGDVSVTTGSNATITGATLYGIQAKSLGTGSIIVTTASGDIISSASTGLHAVNQAALIPLTADSTIAVYAYGSINSGTTPTGAGSTPAGIGALYQGGTQSTPNANVYGNIFVYNYANITAAAGDGIRAIDYGNGNVTVNDEQNTSINSAGGYGIDAQVYGTGGATVNGSAQTTINGAQTGIGVFQNSSGPGDLAVVMGASAGIAGTALYGIEAGSAGTGSIFVSTSTGDIINSGSSGITVFNSATAIPNSDASIISVTAYGTINSGSNAEGSFSPAGISVAYRGASSGPNTPNLNVFGNITINNSANITASAGYGIKAFNYGNGNVTVSDLAGSTVTGVLDGIFAAQRSGGIGNVMVTVGVSGETQPATVTANTGVFAQVTGTGTVGITNYGSITGTTGQAIGLSLAAGDIATINNYGTINGGVSPTASATIFNYAGGTWNVSQGSMVFAGPFENDGSLVANGATFDITGALTGTGTDTVENAGTLELAAANAQIVTFAGSGGTLIANGTVTGGSLTGISATSTSGGAITIDAIGNVTSTGADAIDATTNPGGAGDISIMANGTVTGAINGISAI